MTKVAGQGVTYTELKALDIFEFFALLRAYEKQLKDGRQRTTDKNTG